MITLEIWNEEPKDENREVSTNSLHTVVDNDGPGGGGLGIPFGIVPINAIAKYCD